MESPKVRGRLKSCSLDQGKGRIARPAMSDIVLKLWGFCHTLRHDGIDGSGDYIKQLSYPLLLKMADEWVTRVPKWSDWSRLKDRSGANLPNRRTSVPLV
jgi:type I restriction enzyme M protein